MQIKTFLCIILGFIFLIIGAIGIVLPILPTTPFVLVSAACFSSSPRIRAVIMKFSFFNEHIENYKHRKGVSKKTFILSLIWLWGMLVLSMIFMRQMWSFILLPIIGVSVSIHIFWMSKGRKEKGEQ